MGAVGVVRVEEYGRRAGLAEQMLDDSISLEHGAAYVLQYLTGSLLSKVTQR